MLLLQLMALAEAAATTGPQSAVLQLRQTHSDVQSDSTQDSSCASNTAASDLAYVQTALQHYGLHLVDAYQSLYLNNAAAAPLPPDGDNDCMISPSENGHGSGSVVTDSVHRSHPLISTDSAAAGGDHSSAAALLVWLSRTGQASAILHRVLQIAQEEQQLSLQVSTCVPLYSAASCKLQASGQQCTTCMHQQKTQQGAGL